MIFWDTSAVVPLLVEEPGSGQVLALLQEGAPAAVWWGTAWHYDMPSLVAASGMNGNSLMVDPSFVNTTSDLHPQAGSACAGRGVNIPTITIDNEGQTRPQPAATAPDAGAYETTEDCSPLSGTYTIGPAVGNNFPTFTAAVQKMNWLLLKPDTRPGLRKSL